MSDMSILQALCIIASLYDEQQPSEAELEAMRLARKTVKAVANEIVDRIHPLRRPAGEEG